MSRSPGFYQFRRLTFLMQIYAGCSWGLAWLARDAGYAYNDMQLGLLMLCFAAGATASLFARSRRQLILASFTTIVVLAEAFRVLAVPSANASTWTLVVATIFTLATAPVFNHMLQYWICTAVVWMVFGRFKSPFREDHPDWGWGLLVQLGTIILGVLLNMSFVHLRRRSKRFQVKLERMAYEDPLTGIANRRSLLERLSALHAGGTWRGVYFLMIDLDDFKQINDRFGHEQGDAVLRDMAAVLREHAGLNLPGRLGGEEFGMLMDDCTRAEATALAQTLVRTARGIRVDAPSDAGASGRWLSISIGVAAARAGDMPSDLMRRADEALYRAKREGKDRYVVYESADDAPPSPDPGALPLVAALPHRRRGRSG